MSMNKIIFQVVLVVISVGLFFTVADPLYRSVDPAKPGIKMLKEETGKYDEALDNYEKLVRKREELLAVRNSMDEGDRNDLERLLPDSIDNIRLLIDIDSIALRYGLVLKNLRFTGDDAARVGTSGAKKGAAAETAGRESGGIIIGGNETVGAVTFGFSVSAPYETFKEFLHDLEKSLRLLDVTDLAIRTYPDKDFYDFDITIKTYWLR